MRSSGSIPFSRSSKDTVPGLAHSPPTATDPAPRAPPVNDAAEDLMTPPEPVDGTDADKGDSA